MSEIALDYAVPPADLAAFVTAFYLFRADVPHFEDMERADHAQFRFKLDGGVASYRFADGTEQPGPEVQIIGPTTGATRVSVEGPVRVFGAGLQPAGWAALMRVDASALANRVFDATEVLGPAVTAIADQLRAETRIEAMVEIAACHARELLAGIDRTRFGFAEAVDAWLAASASPDVEELVRMTGLSRRQLERNCKALYGAPPKLLARKYRALRAAHALAAGAHPADLLDEGFYDQSHLIREVKQFTGATPKQMHDHPGLLAQLTMSGRAALAGQVPTLVSDT
ncbi:AraC family transcriptional regulator [Sphingomonas gilva]|uniref:AraC family transcriptional regulator n=1 Tax=Sphingomonas gilva TaxID=2305907 RepID=A0A396RP36_9SPHN|nr:helix-turn-helix domain-containing protein [Sphingomonas gilva]RHW18270.1 AraC family transcriptional regulator [Sphingomonas gilva]